MITLQERAPSMWLDKENNNRSAAIDLRVAVPGIIRDFNSAEQTVTVECAIREKVRNINGEESWENIPPLLDVPLVIPRAGGYSVTLPVKEGDECLVIFADACIDAWWQSGGVQNQIDCRRHDLSDGFAVLGTWSQPNVIPNYSKNSVQIRTDSGSSYIEISGDTVNIKAANINLIGRSVIEGTAWKSHTHSGVKSGGSNTGGVAN